VATKGSKERVDKISLDFNLIYTIFLLF